MICQTCKNKSWCRYADSNTDVCEYYDFNENIRPDKNIRSDKNVRPNKNEYYLGIAKAVAGRSTCLRRQYGAVIVNNDEIISTGYNGAPRGEENCCDRGTCYREGHKHNDGNYDNCCSVHAEMNSIISASRAEMLGATLYLAGFENGRVIAAEPCPVCRRLIINAGIKEVIGTNDES